MDKGSANYESRGNARFCPGYSKIDGWLTWRDLCDAYEKLWSEPLQDLVLFRYGPRFEDVLIGQSPSLKNLLSSIQNVARTNATVLLEGDSGTGKGAAAKTIWQLSERKDGPFIHVNCAAIPENLFESDMYGHVKGAFTGTNEDRVGKFKLADSGILFLDQAGDIISDLQAKLLLALEEKQIWRVGADDPTPVDVRIVAASTQPLRELVQQGKFRSDLYQRLGVVHITVPSLKERRDDVPILTRFFITLFSLQENKHQIKSIRRECERALLDYPWPANIRELMNVIHQAVIMAPGPSLSSGDVRLEPVELASKETDNLELQLYRAICSHRQRNRVKGLKEIMHAISPTDRLHMSKIIADRISISTRQAQRILKTLKSSDGQR